MGTATPACPTGFDLEVKRLGREAPHVNSRPLALEVRRLVDVVYDTGVIDLEDLHPFGVLSQELARAVVAVQGRKFLVEAPRESDRVPALAMERRRGDRCALLQSFRDDPDGFGTDERHVSERDDPTLRVGSRAHAGGKARSHTLARVLAHDSVAAGIAQHFSEPL